MARLLKNDDILVEFPWATASFTVIAHEAVHVGQFVADYAKQMKSEASTYPKMLYPYAWKYGVTAVRMEIAAEASAQFLHKCYALALEHGVPLEAFQPRNTVEIDGVAVVDSQPGAHETDMPRVRRAHRKRAAV